MSNDRIADVWGERTAYAAGTVWPVRIDTHLAERLMSAMIHYREYAARARPISDKSPLRTETLVAHAGLP